MRHLMRHFLIFVLTISFNVSYGQDFAYPSIESQGQSIADFVPIGWTILDSATGDLNTDGLKAYNIHQSLVSVGIICAQLCHLWQNNLTAAGESTATIHSR